jgi:signal transduction histidine kinase
MSDPRPKFKSPDFSQRVFFVALMPALFIALVMATYFLVLRHADADEDLRLRGAALTRQLAPAAEYGVFSGNLAELRRLAEATRREDDVTAVSFFDRDGLMLVSVGQPRLDQRVHTLPDSWQARSADRQTLFFHALIHYGKTEADDLAASTTTGLSATDMPSQKLGSVVVEMSRVQVIKSNLEMLGVTMLFTLGTLLLGILLAHRLGRDVSEPVRRLQEAVDCFHHGRLDVRVQSHPNSVLQTLEEGVNEMAAALESGRDHLEQRIAEATAQLREKKDEAERTSQAKSRFLAAASHDLRQPLHALTLFTDALEQQSLTRSQRQLLKQMSSAVDAMRAQLGALLDISRLDLGETQVQLKPVQLEPLIERAIAVHAPDAHAKGLRLHHVPTRLAANTDARLLERMLGNLLANAIRYTERGGVVVGVRRRGEGLCLQVWDSGVGIETAKIPLIFQEFYQIGNAERDAEKGLGLGLSIVARLAQLLEHSIDVRSRPGRGTVFGITLPLAPVVPEAQVCPDESPARCFDLDLTVALLGLPDGAEHTLITLLTSWGCRVQRLAALPDQTVSEEGPLDLLMFAASEAAQALRFVALTAAAASTLPPPALIQLGELGEGAAMSPYAGEAADESEGAQSRIIQLKLPLRPARLRALLQQCQQARRASIDEPNDMADAKGSMVSLV